MAFMSFPNFMNLNFHNKLNKFIMIYIDDILIYFKLTKKHAQH